MTDIPKLTDITERVLDELESLLAGKAKRRRRRIMCWSVTCVAAGAVLGFVWLVARVPVAVRIPDQK